MNAHHIHLAVAKRITELLDVEEDPFYFGAVVADFTKKVPKKSSHFQKKAIIKDVKVMLPDYNEFYKKYKEKISNPVYLGYLVHIMTDYYFNNNTFSNYWVIENKIIVGAKLNNGNIRYGDMLSRRRLRINDYEVFDNYVSKTHAYKTPSYSLELYEYVKELKLIPLNKEDIFTIIESLNLKEKESLVRKIFKKKYKLYTNEEMNKCFEDCIKFIEDFIIENIIKIECK